MRRMKTKSGCPLLLSTSAVVFRAYTWNRVRRSQTVTHLLGLGSLRYCLPESVWLRVPDPQDERLILHGQFIDTLFQSSDPSQDICKAGRITKEHFPHGLVVLSKFRDSL